MVPIDGFLGASPVYHNMVEGEYMRKGGSYVGSKQWWGGSGDISKQPKEMESKSEDIG